MMFDDGPVLDDREHKKFRVLAALHCSGALTPTEISYLRAHLAICQGCRRLSLEYRAIANKGIPLLAASYIGRHGHEDWDSALYIANEAKRRWIM